MNSYRDITANLLETLATAGEVGMIKRTLAPTFHFRFFSSFLQYKWKPDPGGKSSETTLWRA
jgi:hypothetical protein